MASDDGPGSGSGDQPASDPFANLPMFGDLAKALAGQGPLNWDAARQFASLSSSGGTSERNVDPAARIVYGLLAGHVSPERAIDQIRAITIT